MSTIKDNKIALDEIPMSKFHWKVFFCCAGCPFMDGYVLGIIAVSLSIMTTQISMSPAMSGLVGMATLIGMFLGSLFGGHITDRIGRKKMFFYDFLFITIVAALQFFVNSPMQVFAFRVLLGLGLGADYGIAGPYISEFAPRKNRGSLVGMLNAFWYFGYAISYVVGYLLLPLGNATSWKWMLVSSVIPSLIWLLARSSLPESPRWLMSKGREQEANAIIKKRFGDNVIMPEDPADAETKEHVSYADIFKNGYGKWVFFAAAFWTLQIIPTFGIGTYLPTIVGQFGFNSGNMQYLGSAIMNILYLIGLIPIYFLMDSWGRRPTLIWTFFLCAASLIILGAIEGLKMPFAVIVVLFVIFGASNTAGGSHQWVYPNELFPTRIRATAVGFITAVTRVLSAFTTFLYPIIMSAFGLAVTLYICGGLCVAGFILALVMAPETKNMKLDRASSITKSGILNERSGNL